MANWKSAWLPDTTKADPNTGASPILRTAFVTLAAFPRITATNLGSPHLVNPPVIAAVLPFFTSGGGGSGTVGYAF